LSGEHTNSEGYQTWEVLNDKTALAIEADGIVIGFCDDSRGVHALSECIYEGASETAVTPAGHDRNRADPIMMPSSFSAPAQARISSPFCQPMKGQSP
jgi:hypothetical protein